jgi:hypothetical protein
VPRDHIGQLITFASEIDPDATYARYIWVRAKHHDTIKAIASRRGHPEMASDILTLNKGRDVLPHPKRKPHQKVASVPKLTLATQTLRPGAAIRLPGNLQIGEVLHVHAGDSPPQVRAGYAKYDTVDVHGRIGINRFLGYDPIAIDIPIQFENYAANVGTTIEQNIQTLERFAGRGDYPGAAFGPPAVLRISVTDNQGNVVPLIPPNYQWSSKNQGAPLYRISTIAWDAGALRTRDGYRIRQSAMVTVTQYTPLRFVVRSVARRTLTIPGKSKAA